MEMCNGWRKACANEATPRHEYYCHGESKVKALCAECYQLREDELEDADAQSREHDRKLREEMAALPPNVINPATGLPVEFDA